MDNTALINFLCASSVVSLAAARQIAEKFNHRTIKKNTVFLMENTVNDEYIFLEEGFIRSYVHNMDGKEVTTNFYSDKQHVIEVASFFTRLRTQENFQAITDCEVWYINYDGLNELFHTLPEYREFGRLTLAQGFAELKLRMITMSTDRAEERYAQLITGKPEVFKYAPLKHIASYLGVTDTSLSRIRKEFKKK